MQIWLGREKLQTGARCVSAWRSYARQSRRQHKALMVKQLQAYAMQQQPQHQWLVSIQMRVHAQLLRPYAMQQRLRQAKMLKAYSILQRHTAAEGQAWQPPPAMLLQAYAIQ